MAEMKTEGHFCERCQKFVLAQQGYFQHLHEGTKTCLVCRKCGGMVYLKFQPDIEMGASK